MRWTRRWSAIERSLDEHYRRLRILRVIQGATLRVEAINREVRMSKLGAVAERLKAKKAVHDAKADEWASRLDALDRREPEAFRAGDTVIGEREVDLAEMEATMRNLSNLNGAGS